MSTHKKIFVNPFHTKKVFANIKRTGKDFSGRITPLFDTMMLQPVEEIGEDSYHPTDSTQIPIIDQPSSSSLPKKKQPSKKAQRQEAEVPQDEAEHEESRVLLILRKAKDDVEMPMEAKVDGKDDQQQQLNHPKVKGDGCSGAKGVRVPQEDKNPSSSKDKGKGIMIVPEVPLIDKDQLALDEQIARVIQAKWMLNIRRAKVGNGKQE
ncbi:hypothetical protein Tco_0760044 [Tanacetum coccineum]